MPESVCASWAVLAPAIHEVTLQVRILAVRRMITARTVLPGIGLCIPLAGSYQQRLKEAAFFGGSRVGIGNICKSLFCAFLALQKFCKVVTQCRM